MSPMLDIQRRHAEVFRLRLGDKDNGKPRKLTDAIRVTSHSREIVAAFCDVYGGTAKAWRSPKGAQWEAYLPTTALAVMVLPGQSISQWWELYRGSVCERRCDGEVEQLSDKPCMCPSDVDVRVKTKGTCAPTTRLSVICPDVAVVGAGVLVTHGLIAAETLPQSIKVAEAALVRGVMVPATLRVVVHKARTEYVYPQLEIHGISLYDLLPAGSGAVAGRALDGGGLPAIDVPAPRELASVAAVRTSGNGGPPLPPLPSELAGAASPLTAGEGDAADGTAGPAGTSVDTEDDTASGEASPPQQPDDDATYKNLGHACQAAGLSDDDRHNLAAWASAGRTASSKQLAAPETAAAIEAVADLASKSAQLVGDDDGWRLIDSRYGWTTALHRRVYPLEVTDGVDLPAAVADLRSRIEQLTSDAKQAWKASGLPALSRLTAAQVPRAREVVAHLEAGEPF